MGRKFGSELGWAILNAVADGIEILEYSRTRPTALLRHGLQDLKILEKERERRRIQNAVSRLKKQKLVEERVIARGRFLALTELGTRTLDNRNRPPPLPEGYQTIVVFDIPERFRDARLTLRRYLRSLGFTQLQRSVWISDADWAWRLKQRFDELDVSVWISVFKGQKMF